MNHFIRICIVICLMLLAGTTLAQEDESIGRISIRTVDGVAEFYNTATGETFTPRGVNYLDLRQGQDRVFATNMYESERIREAFRTLADYGYNTVRIFFDTCDSGAICIGNVNGDGLNPEYLDNMVDLMNIAGEEGIYLLLTANSIPPEGGYWEHFYETQFEPFENPGFNHFHENGYYLHAAGVAMHKKYWEDLLSGLVERDAPFETVLGWQLQNEYWLFKNAPPLSLTSGNAVISNGQSYDMSDPEQKRQMVIDGTRNWISELTAVVKEYDPEGLVTTGFFAPQFPNPTGIGGDWYVDTAPLVEDSDLDFFDFHPYSDMDLPIDKQSENLGIVGYTEKPVIMGETGTSMLSTPSVESATEQQAQWIVDSCEFGFDGWLHWTYYPNPDWFAPVAWAFLDGEGLIMRTLAPSNQPDPCQMPELLASNVLLNQPARASRSVEGETPDRAVDGTDLHWCADSDNGQWIEVELAEPTSIASVLGSLAQWPDAFSRHEVWARLADNREILITIFGGTLTHGGDVFTYHLPAPLLDVVSIRFLTTDNGSWSCWFEIEAVNGLPEAPPACVVSASGTVNLRAGAGTNYEIAGSLAAGTGAIVTAAEQGEDGFTWWQLPGEVWVREDVISTEGECDTIPLSEA